MNNSANVTAGKPAIGGAIYQMAVNETLPTDTTTDVTSETCLGYISQDGITNSNTPANTNVKAWGGNTVLSIAGDKTDTFQFKLLEVLNVDVLKTVFGKDNVTGTLSSGITINVNSKDLDEYAYIIDMLLRDGVAKRVVIPNAKVITIAPVKYSDTEPVGYDVTIEAYPDADGNTHYEYIKK
ncbi:MAG: phage tail protein [Bacilli bacterium]|nr:phage tail protein [Bacilli bacterium]